MKKGFLLSVLVFLISAVSVVLIKQPSGSSNACAFCEESVLKRQQFYEDDLVIALYSHKPVVPGHLLVIPKRHVERFEELSNEELLRIKEVVAKIHAVAKEIYGTSDYLLLQKNGTAAGQTVPHLHVHYFPRNAKESAGPLMLLRFLIIPHLPPISNQEMTEITELFKSSI
ncbi:MAG: HIT family protein [Simkania sp.]|nr:HIT family protein [Simkania sp.]